MPDIIFNLRYRYTQYTTRKLNEIEKKKQIDTKKRMNIMIVMKPVIKPSVRIKHLTITIIVLDLWEGSMPKVR